MQQRSTFSKRERIVSQKLVDLLFTGARSRSMAAFPLFLVYREQEEQTQVGSSPVQVLFSVPKRRLHHAVDRNRVKRQLREAYRRNKPIVCDALPEGKSLLLAFVWQTDRLFPTAEVTDRVQKLLRRVSEKL